jgi:hypothetical protein
MILTDLQTELQGRCLSDEVLKTVPTLIEDKSDIAHDVAQALGPLNAGSTGLVGACILVRQPQGSDDFPDVWSSPLDADYTFTVIENPTINRGAGGTGQTALAIARRVHRIMKNFIPAGLAQNFTPLKPCIVPNDDFPGLPSYDVRFRTQEADTTVYLKVAMPVITLQSQGGGFANVTMACATPGASIYYTLLSNAGFPSSVNGSAGLYNGVPVVVQQPKIVRAAAFLNGYVASDVGVLSV